MLRETLSSPAAVERLAHAVIHRFPRPTEVELDLNPVRPVVERDAVNSVPWSHGTTSGSFPRHWLSSVRKAATSDPLKLRATCNATHSLVHTSTSVKRGMGVGSAKVSYLKSIAHLVFGASTMGSPCRIVTARLRPTHCVPALRWAHHFFLSASRRIVLSSVRSATTCLSRRFSTRSCLS
jgi:hypothetical protein